jgi:ATP-binding cassette, subfamily B, bacterial
MRLRVLGQVVTMMLRPGLRLRATLLQVVLLDGIAILAATAAPLCLKAVVDRLQGGGGPRWPLLVATTALAASTFVPTLVASLKQGRSTQLVERVAQHLSISVLARRLGADARDGDDDVGLLARLPFALQTLLDGVLGRVAPLTVQTAASVAVVAVQAPPFVSVVLAATLLTYGGLAAAVTSRLQRRASAVDATSAALSHRITDVFAQRRRVVANAASQVELQAIEALGRRKLEAQRALSSSAAAAGLSQAAVLIAGAGLALALAGAWVAGARLGLGEFVLVQSYLFRLVAPMAAITTTFGQSAVAFETLAQVLRRTATRVVREPAFAMPDLSKGVRCRGLTIVEEDRVILSDVSFDLKPGVFYALVGANGSGKSSLVQRLVGLAPARSGQVEVFGRSPADLTDGDRSRFALLVSQGVGLFDRSLGENGLYPPSYLTPDELRRWLRRWRFAAGEEDIDLDARVGPAGSRLSGGQVQKLELARLFGLNTALLVLDEATSALDEASRDQILSDLRACSAERVLLAVTHDRRLAESADVVLYLARGGLAGLGSHQTLWREAASYRHFWSESGRDGASPGGVDT